VDASTPYPRLKQLGGGVSLGERSIVGGFLGLGLPPCFHLGLGLGLIGGFITLEPESAVLGHPSDLAQNGLGFLSGVFLERL